MPVRCQRDANQSQTSTLWYLWPRNTFCLHSCRTMTEVHLNRAEKEFLVLLKAIRCNKFWILYRFCIAFVSLLYHFYLVLDPSLKLQGPNLCICRRHQNRLIAPTDAVKGQDLEDSVLPSAWFPCDHTSWREPGRRRQSQRHLEKGTKIAKEPWFACFSVSLYLHIISYCDLVQILSQWWYNLHDYIFISS